MKLWELSKKYVTCNDKPLFRLFRSLIDDGMNLKKTNEHREVFLNNFKKSPDFELT